ncbi:MAG TPA: response regulator [Chitinophagaceae bacterium]|jgi:CheY-like chemotaxis protein|nr:response regulator [Chitinophagaceae bacterium]
MQEKKILLADDDVEDRIIIQDAMESLDAGDIMMFADNGEQLLNLLEHNFKSSAKPCLIVLDLNMPKLNGTQTLSKIKSDIKFQHIPVIIYSTSINPLEKEKCLSLGANSFITKPISFKESRETAKTFLQYCEPDTTA